MVEILNALFQGGVLLLGGVGSILAIRSQRAGVTRREYRELRSRWELLLDHAYDLREFIVRRGHRPPAWPPGLFDEDDDVSPSSTSPVRGT